MIWSLRKKSREQKKRALGQKSVGCGICREMTAIENFFSWKFSEMTYYLRTEVTRTF